MPLNITSLLHTVWQRLHRSSGRTVQIQSDLHLEVGQQYLSYTFPVNAPLLVLAGDIGRLVDYDGYEAFLAAQAARYDRVFLVLGNHEFYGLSYEAGIAEAHRLVAEPSLSGKVVLLHKARWDDPDSDLTILGCTLWSAIPEDVYDLVKYSIGDFSRIDGWSIERHNEEHVREAAWLREQIAVLEVATPRSDSSSTSRRALLVATHHAPCIDGTSAPEHMANPWTPAFATNLLDQHDGDGKPWSGVNAWVFGHTHHSTTFVRNGIRLVANQRGYVSKGLVRIGDGQAGWRAKRKEFSPTMVIDVGHRSTWVGY